MKSGMDVCRDIANNTSVRFHQYDTTVCVADLLLPCLVKDRAIDNGGRREGGARARTGSSSEPFASRKAVTA
jgi:hypothetical protein